MNDFTKDFAQALFNQDKINDLLRKELQQAVNDLLEAELTAFLGYDPYARTGWNTGNSRNGAYFREVAGMMVRDLNGYSSAAREVVLQDFVKGFSAGGPFLVARLYVIECVKPCLDLLGSGYLEVDLAQIRPSQEKADRREIPGGIYV